MDANVIVVRAREQLVNKAVNLGAAPPLFESVVSAAINAVPAHEVVGMRVEAADNRSSIASVREHDNKVDETVDAVPENAWSRAEAPTTSKMLSR